jgi:hypothetical protein
MITVNTIEGKAVPINPNLVTVLLEGLPVEVTVTDGENPGETKELPSTKIRLVCGHELHVAGAPEHVAGVLLGASAPTGPAIVPAGAALRRIR